MAAVGRLRVRRESELPIAKLPLPAVSMSRVDVASFVMPSVSNCIMADIHPR